MSLKVARGNGALILQVTIVIVSLIEHDQVLCHFITDMHVDDPVHQIETGESDWEKDTRIFVNV